MPRDKTSKHVYIQPCLVHGNKKYRDPVQAAKALAQIISSQVAYHMTHTGTYERIVGPTVRFRDDPTEYMARLNRAEALHKRLYARAYRRVLSGLKRILA